MASRIPQGLIGIAAVALAAGLLVAGVCTGLNIVGDDEPFLANPIEPILDLTPTATATPGATPAPTYLYDPDNLDRTTPLGALNSYLIRTARFDYLNILGSRDKQIEWQDYRIEAVRDHMRGAALAAALEGAMPDRPQDRPLLGTAGTLIYQNFKVHGLEELNTVGPRTLFRLDVEIYQLRADGKGAGVPTEQRGVVDIVLEQGADDIYRITAWVWREMDEPRLPKQLAP